MNRNRTINSVVVLVVCVFLIFSFSLVFVVAINQVLDGNKTGLFDSVFKKSEKSIEYGKYNVDFFGDESYLCTGHCYCYEDSENEIMMEEKRRLSYVPNIVRNLFYVVTATTSVIAVKKAEELLNNDCRSRFENECEMYSIRSHIDDCSVSQSDETSFMSFEEEEDDDIEQNTKTITSQKESDGDTTDFTCIGRCVAFDFARMADDDVVEYVEKRMRESLPEDEFMRNLYQISFQTGIITVKREMMKFCNLELELKKKITVENIGRFEIQEEVAINRFRSIHLHKFCKSNSFFTIDEIQDKFFSKDEPNQVSNPLLRRMFEKFSESKISSEGFNVCMALREYFVPKTTSKIDIEINVPMITMVCHREFTKDEWEKGIPQKPKNLRHWKEGHKIIPDLYKEDYDPFSFHYKEEDGKDISMYLNEDGELVEFEP